MKFKTRLQVTFVTIVLLPLVLTTVAFIVIGIYLMNMYQGYSVQELDYAMMSETVDTFVSTADRAYDELARQAQEDPAKLEDMEYLKMVNDEISRKSTYILVRKNDAIYYAGNEEAARNIFDKLPQYGDAGDLSEDSGY